MTIQAIRPTEQQPIDNLLLREQLAAQAIAIFHAHFTRPNAQEMREIVKCMENQILAGGE